MNLIGDLDISISGDEQGTQRATSLLVKPLDPDLPFNDPDETGSRVRVPKSCGREYAPLHHDLFTGRGVNHEVGQLVDLVRIQRCAERIELGEGKRTDICCPVVAAVSAGRDGCIL